MSEPKGNIASNPSDPKADTSDNKIAPVAGLETETEGRKSEENQQNTKSRNYIGTVVGHIWMSIKHIPKYIGHMFVHEKAAFWTMFFTAVLTYFTYRLVEVTDKVDETARITQRALIHTKGLSMGPRIVDPNTGKVSGHGFNATWENTGTTPTRNATMHTSIILQKMPLPKGYNYPDLYPGTPPGTPEHNPIHLVIGPHGIYNTSVSIPINDLVAVKNNMGHLYFWGWVQYNDVFSDKPVHITEFCTEVKNVNGDGDLTDPKTIMNAAQDNCPEHNCYDEECK